MLLAVRDPDVRTFSTQGLPELRLRGLRPEDASALLTSRAGPELSPSVHDKLVAWAGGNPLALVEVPTSLSADQLSGRVSLAEPLPVGVGVEQAFRGRIERLSGDARMVLVLAAADDTADVRTLSRAASALAVSAAALDELETAGLLRIEDGSVEFRHPLVRSVAYRGALFTERRRAHLALADALDSVADGDRGTWHRAAAATGQDESIAADLEKSAIRARRRGGRAAAAVAFERAARLSENGSARVRRLVAAAEENLVCARMERVGALLDDAEPFAAEAPLRTTMATLRGLNELESGRPASAYRGLVGEAVAIAVNDPRNALRILLRAAEAAWWSGELRWSSEVGDLATGLRHTGTDEEAFTVALLIGSARLHEGEFQRGRAALRQALAMARPLQEPRYLICAAVAASLLGDRRERAEHHAAAVARLRRAGAVGDLSRALSMAAESEMFLGHYTSAAVSASEALRLSDETGLPLSRAYALAVLAAVEAVQGREDACRAHARECMEITGARGLAMGSAMSRYALGVLELGLGRPAEALGHLRAIVEPGSGFAHPLVALMSAPDLVEAAARSGRHEEAGDAVERFSAWATGLGTGVYRAVADRMRALLADGDEAIELYQAAVLGGDASDSPLDHARSSLLLGERLRRARRRGEARPHLRVALTLFEGLGAEPWARRAEAELRASGEVVRARSASMLDELTPQELQIARLVSEGATNRDVAGELFLSPRTVEYHLRNIFAKLNVTARGQLLPLLTEERAQRERAADAETMRAAS
jgi:DNA-binding NarL/FixJ family response regulator